MINIFVRMFASLWILLSLLKYLMTLLACPNKLLVLYLLPPNLILLLTTSTVRFADNALMPYLSIGYPRQFALRTYIADIVPDPNNADEIVPICRFPEDDSGDEIISAPPHQSDDSPIDAFDLRCLASGLKRTSNLEQMICEINPLTTVL